MNNTLIRPVNMMRLEHPEKFYIDVPLDTYDLKMMPTTECKRMEVPRELARYIMALQEEVQGLEHFIKENGLKA